MIHAPPAAWRWRLTGRDPSDDSLIFALNAFRSRAAAIDIAERVVPVGGMARLFQEQSDNFAIDFAPRERGHETLWITAPGEYVAVPAHRFPPDASVAAPRVSQTATSAPPPLRPSRPAAANTGRRA